MSTYYKPPPEPKEVLTHLLIPKENHVWCRPKAALGNYDVTIYPSKTTCANCLTAFRTHTQGRRTQFRVAHTGRRRTRLERGLADRHVAPAD